MDSSNQVRLASKPRRRPGSGNIYKRADGRWEGRLRVDGKLYRVYARTERAAEHEVATLRAKIAGGLVAAPGSETVAEYLERWLGSPGPLAWREVCQPKSRANTICPPPVGGV
jgi:hypothetical protein